VGFAHDVGRLQRVGKLDRLDIADPVIEQAIAPGPTRGDVENRETGSDVSDAAL
jgi:hypothetical protein